MKLSRTRRLCPALLVLPLAACGGGVFFGIGTGDQPPAVSLAVAPGSAAAGDTVRLAAAAVDDIGVDKVAFFRIESNGDRIQVGVDTTEPYELDTVVPTTASGSVSYFARATDTINQSTDSSTVALTVR